MNTKQTHNQRRGSVMLMVLGMLTMIGMLGMTFLIITRMDRQQARATAAKAQADPLIDGIFGAVCTALLEDLYIDKTTDPTLPPPGPYSNAGTGPDAWKKFIDFASDTEYLDSWLDDGTHRTKFLSSSNSVNTDTNGSGGSDAVKYDTKITNADGDTFYAAIRIQDLSGKICLNTAGDRSEGAWTLPIGLVNVGIKQRLGVYNTVHTLRSGGAGTSLTDYEIDCAERILFPAKATYKPFGIEEEIFLRWLGTSSHATQEGRLYKILNKDWNATTKEAFTTYACSRALVRNPVPNLTTPNEDFTEQACLLYIGQNNLNGINARKALYRRMKQFLEKLGLGDNVGDRQKMAAHFVANLWAHSATGGSSGSPWAFVPEDAPGLIAYGLQQDVVISEVFAHNRPSVKAADDPGGTDEVWGYAVELFNPTSKPISLASYSLYLGSTKLVLSGTIAAGNKRVFYNWTAANAASRATPLTIADVFGIDLTLGGNAIELAGLKFQSGGATKVRLVHAVKTHLVPIDEFEYGAGKTLNYSCPNPVSDGQKTVDIRRDDLLTRARYNIAAYKKSSSGARLGLSNGLAATDLLEADANKTSGANYPAPIVAMSDPKGEILTIAGLRHIYFTGILKNGTGAASYNGTPLSTNLIDGTFKDLFPDGPARGRLDFDPINYIGGAKGAADIPAAGWNGGKYPDVPAACLLSEFFTAIPPDPTRTDDKTRIYGRININTAPANVLKCLPIPDSLAPQATAIANAIVAYRKAEGGFKTPGELAMPLASFTKTTTPLLDGIDETHKDYIKKRDLLYGALANVITVQSDTYATTLKVWMTKKGTDPARVIHTWNYIGVIDRSNCRQNSDMPAVLLFTQIR